MPLCGHSDTKLLFLHILIANLYKQKETTKQLHKMPIDQETVVYGSFVKEIRQRINLINYKK